MFIYMMEQVWADGMYWATLSWETRETQTRFWEHWHDYEYNKVVYPQSHMVIDEDYIEF